MGYMGFGLQNWIYRRRPRKPFSKKTRPTFYALPNYEREFKIQPSKDDNMSIPKLVPILLIVFLVFFLTKGIKDFMDYSKDLNSFATQRNAEKSSKAFKYLVDAGEWRLLHHHYDEALRKFEFAREIYPEDERLINFLEVTQFKIDSVKLVELASNH
ncbi:MAG: hypothetical protein ACWA5P_13230 [bacterium]